MPWPFGKKKKKQDDLGGLVVSGPRNGRAMGEAPPKPVAKKAAVPKFDYEADPRRRRLMVEWAKSSKKDPALTEAILEADYLLSGFQNWQGAPPDHSAAVDIVRKVSAITDPFVQGEIAKSVERYRGVTLQANTATPEKYVEKYGGRAQLAGLSGVIHYRVLGTYNDFAESDAYQEAMGSSGPTTDAPQQSQQPQVRATPPPVPSTVGRPPLPPSREGRPALSTTAPQGSGRPLPLAPTHRTTPLPPIPTGRVPTTAQQPQGTATVTAPQQQAQKVALRERSDPRRTERMVLDSIKKNGTASPALLEQLGAKIGKGQTRARGREVTAETEEEYAEIVQNLSDDERKVLARAVKNYTLDSSKVNAAARGQTTDPEAKKQGDLLVSEIDQMFDVLEQKGMTDRTRVTYRLTSYKPGQEMPYGSKIKVGDMIQDMAFVSSSENRQLLTQGILNAPKGTRYVKFTIIGGGGANVSGGGQYTNENEAKFHDMNKKKSLGDKLAGPQAGQAEILFRRNTVFRIESIVDSGTDVHVVVRKVDPGEVKGQVKDSFSGAGRPLA